VVVPVGASLFLSGDFDLALHCDRVSGEFAVSGADEVAGGVDDLFAEEVMAPWARAG
jgi:hypothetical protein